MSIENNYILTIGGFDPSNGAGITQDIKTLESLGAYALSVQTCLTIQNEDEVLSVRWNSMDEIKGQLDILLSRYKVEWVKISLVENLESLIIIINHLLESSPRVNIVWDPVQAASSGFNFNRIDNSSLLDQILERIYLAIPNWNEIQSWIHGKETAEDAAKRLSRLTNLCLKGGHHPQSKGSDLLFTIDGIELQIDAERIVSGSKHGSGCVFAAALTYHLGQGTGLETSIRKAKLYVSDFIENSPGLLGVHHQAKPHRLEY